MKKLIRLFLCILLLLTGLLWLSSYTHHSSIGIDHDYQTPQGVLHVFYRLNWTGNGSLWAGYGSKRGETTDTLEKFDIAGVLLKRSHTTVKAQSVWNQLGFSYIHAKQPKPTFWIGIPSWLPVLILGLLCFVLQRLR